MTVAADIAGEVAGRFLASYGYQPAGVWAAPGRVNLIGEHTDYNDGFVLPFALEQRAYVAAALRPDGRLRATSVQEADALDVELAALSPGSPSGWAAYVAGVLWVLGAALPRGDHPPSPRSDHAPPFPRGDHAGMVDPQGGSLPGLDMLVDGRVPLGSGLSSSHALECAVARAVVDLADLRVAPMDLALLIQRAENEFVGAPTGLMDQAASLLCTAGHALFLDVRSLAVQQVPFDPVAAGLRVLVIDTGVRHSHSSGEYGARRRSCEEAARLLGVPALRDIDDLDAALRQLRDDVLRRRVRHVVTENARVLETVDALKSEDWSRVGALMTASHASLRDDYEVSCVELDVAVESVLEAGALGARMTGGGFGGSAIALVPDGMTAAAIDAGVRAYAARGLRAPHVFGVRPSAGAARVR